jgi:hypothetical protein
MILAVGGRITNENAEKIGSTLQDLSNLCAAFCVAQKMGEDLGYRAILLSKCRMTRQTVAVVTEDDATN